jgi:arylsulfatase A
MSDGGEVVLPEGSYAPDKVHQFAVDFLRRHKDRPFFFYYSMHHVHAPILRTSDSAADAKAAEVLYEDNIRYMDKQVGAMVRELESLGLREKTLLIFTGDNGTALDFPSPLKGKMIDGRKGSMLEGGSRVPFIASWPGTTPKGLVSKDLVSFADPHATFSELAGAKLPENFTFDGRSFAPQLRGEKGHPREWAFVQLGKRWFVRSEGFKLDENGGLFDMSDAPYSQKLIEPDADSEASKAARSSLAAVLAKLNPAAGKTDPNGGNAARLKRKKAATR